MLNKIETIEQHYQLTPAMVLPSFVLSAVCAARLLGISWDGMTCTIRTDSAIAAGVGHNRTQSLIDALYKLAQAEASD